MGSPSTIFGSVRLLSLLALSWFPPEAAQAFSDADRADSRVVIERQIDAFRRDDGEAAFAFAAPGIQALFHDPDGFMAMVRNGYQPVYRPKDYAFTSITETGEGLTDSVAITDLNGEAWTAVYTLEKQPDGSWKITSCHLEKVGAST
jgi:hypothetical protein